MNSLATISQQEVFKNLEKVSVDKANKLEKVEVQNGLGKIEMKVAEAGTKKLIKLMSDQDLLKEIEDSIEYIALDLGIKNFKDKDDREGRGGRAAYASTRFFQVLKNYYDDLTYDEVILSFELSMVGHLDEWLPDGHGHYQDFSFEYVTKILNAYKQYKRKTWTKVNRLIPHIETITEDQKKENKEFILKDIITKFKNYRDEKVKPIFLVPFLVIDEFISAGVLSGRPEVIPEDIEKGFVDVMCRSSKSNAQKAKIKSDKEQGIENEDLNHSSERYSHERQIIKVFDEIISSGLDIEDVIQIAG